MKTLIFLVILGMHPVDNSVKPVALGPFNTPEACNAEWESFTKQAIAAGMQRDAFNGICVRWTNAQEKPV